MRAPLTMLIVGLSLAAASAQTRFTYSSGQPLSPAYEGWMPNADGSFTMYFGYMNTNWQQEFDIPVGPDNAIEPGGPDRGQPTHFYPRRSPFLFTVKVPNDFGTKELIWTLKANGRTEKAYASLKSDYEIDPQVISTEVGGDFGSLRDELRTNIPPDLRVEVDRRGTLKVGEPIVLSAFAGDPDNLPARRDGRPQPGVRADAAKAPPAPPARGANAVTPANASNPANPANPANRANPSNPSNVIYRPPSAIVPQMGPGLHVSWIVYRGNASAVTFSPDQMKTWTDTRAYANSPWSPPYTIPIPPEDGKWLTKAIFSEPGTYVLRAVATDGALFTYENVIVTVTKN